MITFKLTGSLQNFKASDSPSELDHYLPSGVPASINVLESLKEEPGLGEVKAQLSASRLSHINTTNVLTTAEHKITPVAQRPFPAIPALSARTRYTRSRTSLGKQCTIVTLDIETAPFHDEDISISHVALQLSDGEVEDLCSGHVLRLPKTCRPKDHLAFLFRLFPNDGIFNTGTSEFVSKSLSITIEATALSSEACRPKIQMNWRTTVDFSTPLNPGFAAPGQTMQRSKRPPILTVSLGSGDHVNLPQSSQGTYAEVDFESNQRQRALSTGHLGVTMTLTAPRDVYVGEPFTWDVFVVNRSSVPRKLAIITVPKRKPGDWKGHLSKHSSSSSISGRRGEIEHADAGLDENRLYAMQRNLSVEEEQIVSLSTEVRLG